VKEMIVAQKQTVGLAKNRPGPGRGKAGTPAAPALLDAPPTLAEAGIDKKLSARAQKIATVQRVRTVRTRMPQDATKGGFPVEVAVEVIFKARKGGCESLATPCFYLVAGPGFEPGTFGL
jgi:hypothetical protein